LTVGKPSWRSSVIFLTWLVCIGGPPPKARAETFPSRQVTIISPYQAGGTSDIIGSATGGTASCTALTTCSYWWAPVTDSTPG